MKIMVPAVDATTGRLLIDPLEEEDMARALLRYLPARGAGVHDLTAASATGTTFRGAKERTRSRDIGDPLTVGWTYLIAADEPERDRIAEAIGPLARRRGMKDPHRPLEFAGEAPEEWFEWMLERYWSVEADPPDYVLIIGGPDRVPFQFQAVLDSAASVGRLAFDDVADLSAYVDKVLRLEDEAQPCDSEALIFATDHGPDDPTYYSRRYMAEPLAEHVTTKLSVSTTVLTAEHATRTGLLSALDGRRPALVYTATHGAGSPNAPQEEQERTNGAIVCQSADGLELVTADDVPDDPIIEGGVLFQFACFGYGTPAESDYNHWLGEDRLNAQADFIAALPKRLIAHPRGPVAYIGHVDLAWLHGFNDPEAPDLVEAWHPRMAPFVSAVQALLAPQPLGLAMQDMNKRFDIGNAQMASTYDRQQRGRLPDTAEVQRALVRAFITRSDAQNYLVFGDPAVYIRIAEKT